MQTVMRFSGAGARFDNKKSPHNNLNHTIPSGMALVRVRYVAIESQKLAPEGWTVPAPLWVIMPLEDKMHGQRNFVLNVGFGRSPTSVFEFGFVKSDSKIVSWYRLALLAADANTKIF